MMISAALSLHLVFQTPAHARQRQLLQRAQQAVLIDDRQIGMEVSVSHAKKSTCMCGDSKARRARRRGEGAKLSRAAPALVSACTFVRSSTLRVEADDKQLFALSPYPVCKLQPGLAAAARETELPRVCESGLEAAVLPRPGASVWGGGAVGNICPARAPWRVARRRPSACTSTSTTWPRRAR